MRRIMFVMLLAIGLCADAAASAQNRIKPVGVYDPGPGRQVALQDWRRFNAGFGNRWRIEWNRVTGTPHRIDGHFFEIAEPLDRDRIEPATRSQLSRYSKLLQIDPTALALSKAEFSEPKDPSRSRGTWHVYYRQQYKDLPVFGGSVRMVIRDQRVTMLGSDYYPGIDVKTQPSLKRGDVMRIIRQDSGFAERRTELDSKLLIYPQTRGGKIYYYLAWQVTLPVLTVPADRVRGRSDSVEDDGHAQPDMVPVEWRYFIDAHTGAIIHREDLLRYADFSGTVTGMIFPEHPTDAQTAVPISNMTVKMTAGGTDYFAITDVNGDYLLTGLPAGAGSLEAHLTGPNVEVHNDETPDPDATYAQAITIPGTQDWNWQTHDPSPNDIETHIFWHVNWIFDWFQRGDPFNVVPDPHPMPCYVRTTGLPCNASAGATGLRFYLKDASCAYELGLCCDVVYHEFTHRVVDKIYDSAGVALPYSGQTGAMDEGWADYFGSTATGSPQHGEVCYYGRDIDTPDLRFPKDYIGSVHGDNPIFSGSIWDVRTDLGAAYTDELALRAMKLVPTSFNEYLAAFLETDDDPAFSSDPATANNNPSDGTPNVDTICHHFYDVHGIYCAYCVGETDNPIAFISSPPINELNRFRDGVLSITIEGTAAGSSTNALSNFVLEYGAGEDPASWSSAGIAPTGGGTSEIVDDVLGTWDITAVGDGLYTIRLTVTDAGSNTAQIETQVRIDRLLATVWPVSTDLHFSAAPVIANVDAAYPGLEIVAAGDGFIVVVHADGTMASGWPQFADFPCMSAPAVGDLDNDGDLEVVYAYNYRARVHHHDGSRDPSFDKNLSPSHIIGTAALEDLDNDGDLEVVVATDDGTVHAWQHDGTDVAGWPVTAGGAVYSSAAIGDLDRDGTLEVVIGCEDFNVYAWHADGTAVAGWPQATTGAVSTSPVLGDIDGDQDLEIIVASQDTDVYAWQHGGTAIAGWPIDMGHASTRPASPALADVDGDGDMEIFVLETNDRLHGWQGNGTPLAGFPFEEKLVNGHETWISTPVIGDIDGDGDPEIVFEGTGRFSGIHAAHHDGTSVTGWPRYVNSFSNGTPAVADLDLDGDAEVIAVSDGIFVWDLPGTYARSHAPWPTYRRDNYRTGTAGPNSGVVLLLDTSGSMSWDHNGNMTVPVDEQRLSLAKQAAYPFMDMLNDYNEGKANFAIAVFPSQPWTYSAGCSGQIVTPSTLVTTATKTTANTVTIPGLTADGNTPLLAGMTTAQSLLGVETNQAIVLLSDGYHNCPAGVAVTDPDVVSLVDQLKTAGVRVFTIGFGRPTDVDHPLLEEFADETTPAGYAGSQFYDVTVPGFSAGAWTPATELQDVCKSILVDALGLEAAVDPLGVIAAGATETHPVFINEHDNKVSFYVSWATPGADRLDVTVRTSDGQPVPTGATTPGVRVHEGITYKIVTVDGDFLGQPGKVGPTAWKLEIAAANLGGRSQENYQYSVIMQSALKMQCRFDKSSYYAGDTVRLTARMSAAGVPITGLTDVVVEVTGPDEGQGNWLVQNRVTQAELDKVPATIAHETLSVRQRLGRYLIDERMVTFPGVTSPMTVQLYDDGAHSDGAANDGVYSNTFNGASKEGVYAFDFRSSGPTARGNSFERQKVLKKHLSVRPRPDFVQVDVRELDYSLERQRQFMVAVTPRDHLGNFLGPGYGGGVQFQSSHGGFTGSVRDNLDGSYQQVLTLPSGVNPEQVQVTIGFADADVPFNLGSKIAGGLKSAFGLSLHAGIAVPSGDYDTLFDPGLMLGLDFEYGLAGDLTAVATVGYNQFTAGDPTVEDTYWLNFSADLKRQFPALPLQPFVNGGLGLYKPEDGDTEFGVNVGLGRDLQVNQSWVLQVGADYHRIFASGVDGGFIAAHAGGIYRF